MPIKFRCTHCQQFLGISQSKAGQLVDCPTCGRMVRVPHLDGRIDPILEPGLNFQDPGLVEALEELAQLDGAHWEPNDSGSDSPRMLATLSGSTAAVESISGETVPVAEPIARTWPEPPDDAMEIRSTNDSAASPPVRTDDTSLVEILSTIPPPSGESPSADAASLRTASAPPLIARLRLAERISQPFVTVAAVMAIFLVAFGLGFLAGNYGGAADQAGTVATNAVPINASVRDNLPTPHRIGDNHRQQKTSVEGRITYRTSSGESRPDRGAMVIVLPQALRDTEKLSIVGFRPADDRENRERATARLRTLGGDATAAGPDGRFEISLPQTGTYHILALSHYQARQGDTSIPPAHSALLAEYFERPEQLLGRLSYHLGQIRYRGAEAEPWDCSFERLPSGDE